MLGGNMRFTVILTVAFVLTMGSVSAKEFGHNLRGKRLILKGASCAGMEFKDNGRVDLFDEIVCSRLREPTLVARIRWLTNDLFVLTETKVVTQGCPPRNWIYRVDKVSANQVTLTVISTGWKEHKDETLEYDVAHE